MNRDKLIFILTMAFTLIIWSSAFTFIRVALESFQPESLALLRFLIASAFLFIYGLTQKISLPRVKDLPAILLSGLLGISIYHTALNTGETFVSAGTASMILNMYPIFVAILSTIFLHEDVSKTKWTGIIISFLGITFVSLGESEGLSLSPGIILLLIAAVSSTLYDISQKKLLSKYKPIELTTYLFCSGTLFLTIFSRSLIHDIQKASLSSVLPVIYLGIFPGAIAYLTWTKALSKNPITNISSLQYTIPIFTIVISFLLLKEIPPVISLIGGAIVFAGVLVVTFSQQLNSFLSKKYAYAFLPHLRACLVKILRVLA